MNLTRTERWVLSNQYRILEDLDPEGADHYRECREALERGFKLHYRWIVEHINEDELTEEQCREVGDILCMFEELRRAYDRAPEKFGMDESKVRFPGFDGNKEAGLASYAEYYRKSGGGRFPELEIPPGLNSHMPMIELYRRMLAEWNNARVKTEVPPAEAIRIISILHPVVTENPSNGATAEGKPKKGKKRKGDSR